MSDQRVGAAFRAVRLRRGWRQIDVAAAAKVSAGVVSEIEHGRLSRVTVETLRRVAGALGIRVDVLALWRGGELDRLLNVRHNELGVAVVEFLRGLGWEVAPEVSFAIAGERGVVDILAWHRATRTLLIVELKTELVDPQGLIATLGRKTRLAARIGREHGWSPAQVGSWLVVAEGSTNRHRVDLFGPVLRSALPADGATMRRWLASPAGTVAGLSFFSNFTAGRSKQSFAGSSARPSP